MGDFTFDPISHEYFLGSRKLYGVTEVIRDNGLMNGTAFFTEESRDRGNAVHRAMELLVWGNLDWNTVDERIKPYVDSGALFFDHTKLSPKRTECRRYDAALWIAGTWDWDNEDLLLDYKSGAAEAWHRVQSSAYQELARVNGIKIKRRGSLYLQPDGSIAKLKEHTDRNDLKVFLSGLNLSKWRTQL